MTLYLLLINSFKTETFEFYHIKNEVFFLFFKIDVFNFINQVFNFINQVFNFINQVFNQEKRKTRIYFDEELWGIIVSRSNNKT